MTKRTMIPVCYCCRRKNKPFKKQAVGLYEIYWICKKCYNFLKNDIRNSDGCIIEATEWFLECCCYTKQKKKYKNYLHS